MTCSALSRRGSGTLAIIASIVLAACAPSGSTPSSTTPSATASASASDEATGSQPAFACAPSITVPSTTDRAQITDVRVGTHIGYDRVVFEFASGIPQTLIEDVLSPFYADPSDLPLDVAGSDFLKLTMHDGTKVSPDGVLTYTGPTSFEPGFDRIVQLIEGGDFEAISTWYLGLNGGGCLRVLTLADPSRLVIDIEH